MIKGWVHRIILQETKPPLDKHHIHVHQTSPSAIEGEAVIPTHFSIVQIPVPKDWKGEVKYILWTEGE